MIASLVVVSLVLSQRPPPTIDDLGGRFDVSLPIATSLGLWMPVTPVQPFFQGVERSPSEGSSNTAMGSFAIGPSIRVDQSRQSVSSFTLGLSSGLWFHPWRLAPGASFIQLRPLTAHFKIDFSSVVSGELGLGAVVNFTALSSSATAFGSGGFSARLGVDLDFTWFMAFIGVDFSLAGGFPRLGLLAELGPAVRRLGRGGLAPEPAEQPLPAIPQLRSAQGVSSSAGVAMADRSTRAASEPPLVSLVQPLATVSAERVSVPVWRTPDLGNEDAPVVVVVFTNAECRPHCVLSYRAVDELVVRRPGKVRVYVRHARLANHVFGDLAAETMVATAHQGKTWALLGQLLRVEGMTNRQALEQSKERAGVTPLESLAEDVRARLTEDAQLVREYGIAAVPTLFVNGRRVVGAHSVEALLAIVDEELGAAP